MSQVGSGLQVAYALSFDVINQGKFALLCISFAIAVRHCCLLYYYRSCWQSFPFKLKMEYYIFSLFVFRTITETFFCNNYCNSGKDN